MKNFTRVAIAGIFFLLSPFFQAPLHAAFQDMLWGARPAGLGGAFTALADDANAPMYNPAGISLLRRNEITMMYSELLTGLDLKAGQDTTKLNLGYVSYVPQILNQKYGSFAVSWANFSVSNLMREDTFILSYADSYTIEKVRTQPLFAYGVNLKYLKHSFAPDDYTQNDTVFANGTSAGAMTVDVGLLFRPNWSLAPGLKLGFDGKNLTRPDVGLAGVDRVPAQYTFGVAYQDRRYRLINPTMDIATRNGRTMVSLGWEGWMMKDTVGLRFGGNTDQIGGGLGYQFRVGALTSLRLDYSLLVPLNIEGSNGSHRVSLTLNF